MALYLLESYHQLEMIWCHY